MKKRNVLAWITILIAAFLVQGCGNTSSGEGEKDKTKESSYVEWEEIGSWEKIKKKAESDNNDHTVEFRIKKIESDEKKIRKEIEEFNSSGSGTMIEPETGNGALEYRIACYEVKFPEDFPDSDFGITDTAIKIKVTSLEGKDEIKANGKVYKKLSKTMEIGDLPQGYDFYSGQTYKGKVLYMKPKENKDYLLKGGGYYFKAEE